MTQTAAILEVLERLERKVDALSRPVPKLLSRRAAAKMLGVDRGSTLAALIREGRIALVRGRIPLGEIERLLHEGLPVARRRRNAENAEADGSIREIPI